MKSSHNLSSIVASSFAFVKVSTLPTMHAYSLRYDFWKCATPAIGFCWAPFIVLGFEISSHNDLFALTSDTVYKLPNFIFIFFVSLIWGEVAAIFFYLQASFPCFIFSDRHMAYRPIAAQPVSLFYQLFCWERYTLLIIATSILISSIVCAKKYCAFAAVWGKYYCRGEFLRAVLLSADNTLLCGS